MEQRVEEVTAMQEKESARKAVEVEKESARKAVEEALAQEREKISSLTTEVEELTALLLTEQEEKTKALVDAEGRNEELNKKVEEADENIKQLRDTLQRYEENESEREALLLTERQETNIAKKSLAEAQERNEELIKRIEDAEEHICQLKDNVQRFQECVTELESSLIMERQQNVATIKELAEAQERVEELLRQAADADGKSNLLQTTMQRLEECLIEREAVLLTERQESEETKKSLAEAQGENEELLKKIKAAEKDIANFQDIIQRLEENLKVTETSLLAERQHSGAIMAQLAEAQGRIEELQKKLIDANRTNNLIQDSLERFEENSTRRDTLYHGERQEHDQTKKALSKAQERNWELLRKVDEAEKSINRLLENVQRLEKDATAREFLLLTAKQNHDNATKALLEAHERNRELINRLEDAYKKISLLEDSVNRFEENTAEKGSMLAIERLENSSTKKVLADAQKMIETLLKEAQHSQKNVKQLEDITRRIEEDSTTREALLLTEKQSHEVTKKTLMEVQERNEEFIKKIQDADKNILQLQFTIQRLEENIAAKEALLLREREQNDAAIKAQAETQRKNEQLLKKFEDVDRTIGLLHNTMQRLGENTAKDTLLLSERQEKDAMKKALTEAEEKNEELLMKIEDANKKIEHLHNTITKLEEKIAAKDASLEAERQESSTIRKSLAEALERNDELLKKVRDSEYKSHQLQDTVQKLQVDAISRLSSFIMEKQQGDAAKKALTEAHGKNEDLLKRNEELLKRNDDLIKKIENSGKFVTQLQETLQRLEGKAANLEAENQVLRKQAIVTPPSTAKSPAGNSKITKIHQRSPETGHIMNGDITHAEMKPSTGTSESRPSMGNASELSNQKDFENGEKLRRVLNEIYQPSQPQKPQDDQLLLLKCVSQYLGFSGSKPVAALLIYQCLLQSRSFQAVRTSVFDSILQSINSATEAQSDTRTLAYWLSNLSVLSVLLQRSFKTIRTAISVPHRRRFSSERIFQPNQSSNSRLAYFSGQSIVGDGGLHQVEAKYPALLFKQQLVDLIEKVYGMISDRVKKEINPLLELCIQDPRTSHSSLAKGPLPHANGLGQQNQLAHWLGIVKILTNYLNLLRANHVPSMLVHKLLTQISSLIDVQLFNRLLLRRECCSFSNGEYLKAGLTELKHWCDNATQEFAGSAWEALRHIRQAVDFLVISLKPMRTIREIRTDVCPALSTQQLERIVGMYWDDVNGTNTISPEFTSSLKALLHEESSSATNFSILLDDDSSIPFSLEDITKSMPNIEMADSDLLPFIRENPSFVFLLRRKE